MFTIQMKAGEKEILNQSYEIFRTTAPRAYDGGGTIEIYDGAGERVVAIQVEQIEWHRGRYSSGLYGMTPEEDIDEYVVNQLFERMSVVSPVEAS